MPNRPNHNDETDLLVSVIIPTRGRDQCVRDTLACLAKQDYGNFEIWLVDQNDEQLENLEASLGSSVFHHEVMPPKGSHAGRNHAIGKAKGKLCVFVDDDVELEPDFLSKHVEAYTREKTRDVSIAGISGRVVQPKDGFSEAQMRDLGELARYSSWTGKATGNFIGSSPGYVDHMHECNFSCETEVLRKAGCFNESFAGNAYFEGTDLALRVRNLGRKFYYVPEVVLTHLQSPSGGNRVQQKSSHTYWFMRNYFLLNSLHMERVASPVFLGWSVLYTLAKAAKNRDAHIAVDGLKGIAHGIGFFTKGRSK